MKLSFIIAIAITALCLGMAFDAVYSHPKQCPTMKCMVIKYAQ